MHAAYRTSSRLVTGAIAVPPGEQHLVEVRERDRRATWNVHVPSAPSASSASQLVDGRRRELGRRGVEPLARRRPSRCSSARGGDLVVRPTADHRLRVVLRVPSLDGVVVALVEDEPVGLARTLPRADEHEVPAQLRAVQLEVQLPGLDRGARVGLAAVQLPGAAIPHDDVTRAVATRRDHPLEVEVLDRMVLHVHREVAHLRVERHALRHRPAHEHAVDLEPEVVVESAGAVALHHEPRCTGRGRRRPAGSGVARSPACRGTGSAPGPRFSTAPRPVLPRSVRNAAGRHPVACRMARRHPRRLQTTCATMKARDRSRSGAAATLGAIANAEAVPSTPERARPRPPPRSPRELPRRRRGVVARDRRARPTRLCRDRRPAARRPRGAIAILGLPR